MKDSFYQKEQIYRDPEEDLAARKRIDNRIFYLLLAAIAFVPLIVGGHVSEVVSPLIAAQDLFSTGMKGELFTFYKFVMLMILTVSAVVLFLYKLFFLNYSLPKRPILWFFLIFVMAIILSTIFAPYKTIAMLGQYNRTDGALSYMCYITLMFIAMNIDYPKKAVQYILYAFYPFVIINLVLITMSFTGNDALTYGPVEKIMTIFLPEGASLSEGSVLLGTLNQWNYMSGMFAVMTVLFLAAAIVESSKSIKAAHFIAALLSTAIMLMSISTSGFLTVLLITPLLVTLAWKSKNKKMALIMLAAFYLLSAPILHMIASKNERVWTESIGFFISTNPYINLQPVANNETSPNLNIFDNRVYAEDKAFSLPELPESGVSSGSGRSYIWGKTLEIVKDRPILGYGLDTLLYHFPHNNIDSRAGLGSETVIVDKPHSMYMGVLFGMGIIGIIGLLGIAAITVWKSLQSVLHFNRTRSLTVALGIAWIAFLIQAMFNDTLPGTAAPLFTIAGVMLSLLYKENVNGRDN
ncbi:O-antigen ligase family protein [Domibacillus epiphyticus]|uniref:O-antigen ligase-related domain-containing protein n=1 Tax=Domibacillus epiphyticus TaxID=1714355 RepID=A0A1V2A6J1_9BACI|nr:O-antigen ligase family protein [Domibacillus epiphyticus]OMP66625.1 hypothetical protein BTO28_11315 [Domibacillus epiphyticus]